MLLIWEILCVPLGNILLISSHAFYYDKAEIRVKLGDGICV